MEAVSNTHRGISPTSFFTDHYELTMVDAARKAGTANRKSVFELFARRSLPGDDTVSPQAKDVPEGLAAFRFDDEQLVFIRSQRRLEDTVNWLADFSFTGDIYAYAEGEPYFPNSPIMQVEATLPKPSS